MVPKNLRYTKEHEWVLLENGKAKVGITHHAQEQLGDIVYVELPKKGAAIRQMTPCGVIESVKAVSEIYAPLTGTVVEINPALNDTPQDVNQDPYGRGWMFVILPSQSQEAESLLDAERYEKLAG